MPGSPERKKAVPGTGRDARKEYFMVRLPLVYKQQLYKLKAKARLPMTGAVQLALESYLAQYGLWPPSDET